MGWNLLGSWSGQNCRALWKGHGLTSMARYGGCSIAFWAQHQGHSRPSWSQSCPLQLPWEYWQTPWGLKKKKSWKGIFHLLSELLYYFFIINDFKLCKWPIIILSVYKKMQTIQRKDISMTTSTQCRSFLRGIHCWRFMSNLFFLFNHLHRHRETQSLAWEILFLMKVNHSVLSFCNFLRNVSWGSSRISTYRSISAYLIPLNCRVVFPSVSVPLTWVVTVV